MVIEARLKGVSLDKYSVMSSGATESALASEYLHIRHYSQGLPVPGWFLLPLLEALHVPRFNSSLFAAGGTLEISGNSSLFKGRD